MADTGQQPVTPPVTQTISPAATPPATQTTPPAPAATQTTPPAPPATQTTPPAPPATQTTPPAPPATQTTPPAPPATQTTPPAPAATQTTPPAPAAPPAVRARKRRTTVPLRGSTNKGIQSRIRTGAQRTAAKLGANVSGVEVEEFSTTAKVMVVFVAILVAFLVFVLPFLIEETKDENGEPVEFAFGLSFVQFWRWAVTVIGLLIILVVIIGSAAAFRDKSPSSLIIWTSMVVIGTIGVFVFTPNPREKDITEEESDSRLNLRKWLSQIAILLGIGPWLFGDLSGKKKGGLVAAIIGLSLVVWVRFIGAVVMVLLFIVLVLLVITGGGVAAVKAGEAIQSRKISSAPGSTLLDQIRAEKAAIQAQLGIAEGINVDLIREEAAELQSLRNALAQERTRLSGLGPGLLVQAEQEISPAFLGGDAAARLASI